MGIGIKMNDLLDSYPMKVEQLINLLPEEDLEFLCMETKIDHQVKKLYGATVFKLLLFSMLNSDRLSLRLMESYLKSGHFKHFAGIEQLDAKYNSIRDRISTMDCTFFERLFDSIFIRYNHLLKEDIAISKVDSTFVGIPAKLMNWAMRNGGNDKLRHVKFTVSLKGSLPCSVQLHTSQDFVNENIALPDAILKNKYLQESVIVFDRGLQTRKKFAEFSDKNILFVGRLKTDVNYKLLKSRRLIKPDKTSTVRILEDLVINCMSEGKILPQKFRLVKAEIIKTNKPLFLITNYLDVPAQEIAAIYKQRWEIEIFFKFLKQHLNLNHIVSRNENAMKVIIYMTLIVAILILAYKKTNALKGYKIPKLKFEIELDNLILKEIVILCGGNPDRASHLFNSS